MNFRVVSNGSTKPFAYQYQAAEYAKECLGNGYPAELWYDSLLDGSPKMIQHHSW